MDKLKLVAGLYAFVLFLQSVLTIIDQDSKIVKTSIQKDYKDSDIKSQVLKAFQEKNENIRRTCKEYRKDNADENDQLIYQSKDERFNQKVKLRSYLVEEERKLTYCWNRKVASSFWTSVFGDFHPELKANVSKLYKLSSIMSPKNISTYLKATSDMYKKILVVRHPLVRLISAYRDRVEGLRSSISFYQSVSRRLGIRRKDKTIRYTTHKAMEGNKTIPVSYWKKVFVPTWNEFVDYILLSNVTKYVSRNIVKSQVDMLVYE